MDNVLVSTGKGALGGAGTGAAIGSAILPGIGTILGAIGGGAIGAISGYNKGNDMEDALEKLQAIPAIDPTMVAFRDELAREKKAVESGFTTDFQVARDMIAQTAAGGYSVAKEIAMTNPAMALSLMEGVGAQSDASINKALGTISTKGVSYTQMLLDMISNMSQRNLDVNVFKASQDMAMATAGMKDFNANANAGMMKLLDPEVLSGFKSIITGQ